MTEPIRNQVPQKPLLKGYVGANGNFTRYNLGNEFGGSVNAGLRVEGRKAIAPFIDMQAHVGSNYGADLQAGVDFDFKKNLGLESSLGVSFQQDFLPTESKGSHIFGPKFPVDAPPIKDPNPMQAKIKGAAKLTYEPNWGSIKVGVEGGIRNGECINAEVAYNNGFLTEVKVTRCTTPAAYITPTLEAEVKLGKESNVSALLDADLRDIKAGIRYTF